MTQKHPFEMAQTLGYQFKNTLLLEEALRHSSFVNEQNDKDIKDNERFEFLGDAVLNLAIGHMLMQCYPDINEGTLSRMRASLVNESRLAQVSRTLGLGTFIRLGKGETQSNGFNKPSILANTFEALIAAIYLDDGYDTAFHIIQRLFTTHMNAIDESNTIYDYKSRLQELVQLYQAEMPHYAVIHEIGPDHDKTFTVKLEIGAIHTEGAGKNKKTAEQDAAKKALEVLDPK